MRDARCAAVRTTSRALVAYQRRFLVGVAFFRFRLALCVAQEDVDIVSPCALGMSLNSATIPTIKAKIVCGAANNQLQDDSKHDVELQQRGIAYGTCLRSAGEGQRNEQKKGKEAMIE